MCYDAIKLYYTHFIDKIIRHRACTLKDTAHAIIAAELDPEFNKTCEEIKEARKKRGIVILFLFYIIAMAVKMYKCH